MGELSGTLGEAARRLRLLEREFGQLPETLVYLRFFKNKVQLREGPTIVKERNIYTDSNDSFILGHATNGVLGTANGVGGNQIILGDYTSSWVTQKIVNPDNTWRELIRDTTFKDASATTGTWDTTNYEWIFANGNIIQTTSIFYNNETITDAEININEDNITNSGNLTYYLSANGGSDWESATLNSSHIFTSTGTDLRLKIEASSGTAKISADDSNSNTTAIEVTYTTS